MEKETPELVILRSFLVNQHKQLIWFMWGIYITILWAGKSSRMPVSVDCQEALEINILLWTYKGTKEIRRKHSAPPGDAMCCLLREFATLSIVQYEFLA